MNVPQSIAGRFRIGTLIGQGGMGEVYRGVDIHNDQYVAVKALRPELTTNNPALLERFLREGEALRRLNHPNIVRILEMVQDEGRYFLVMDYVAGGSLEDLLKSQGQLPIETVLQIGLDLADALTRAHRLNIIHRDIKPANVLLDADQTPRLTDFGVAHIGDRTRLTQTHSMIGTYAYLSPEACHGETPDERTDIWAFGVMLYEMLAGHRPFDADQPGALLTAILTKPVPDLAEHRPDVPPALKQLVERMLEKDHTRRIASVRQVGAELEYILRNPEATPGDTARLGGVVPSDQPTRFATPAPDQPVTAASGDKVAPLTPIDPQAAGAETVAAYTVPQAQQTAAGQTSRMSASTAGAAPPRRGFPWWIAVVIAGVVLLGVGGMLLMRGSDASADSPAAVADDSESAATEAPPPATDTPEPAATEAPPATATPAEQPCAQELTSPLFDRLQIDESQRQNLRANLGCPVAPLAEGPAVEQYYERGSITGPVLQKRSMCC